VKNDTVYDDRSRVGFHDYLLKNNVTLSTAAENYILKQGIYRYKKRPVYDLEFDNQLVRAIEQLDKK
jgi:hypothetical protein